MTLPDHIIGIARAMFRGKPPSPGHSYDLGNVVVGRSRNEPEFWIAQAEDGEPVDTVAPDRFRSLRELAAYLDDLDGTPPLSASEPSEASWGVE